MERSYQLETFADLASVITMAIMKGEECYLILTSIWKITANVSTECSSHHHLITLMTTGAFSRNVSKVTFKPYPRTSYFQTLSTYNDFEITSLTSGWLIAKGGKDALFYSWIAVNDGKGRRVQ